MSKDSTPEILKQLIDELYKSGGSNLPDRRRVGDVQHCDVHDKVHIMHQAIYGPDNKPEEGILHITKENQRFIKKQTDMIDKLNWFVAIGVLSLAGNFVIEIAKFMAKQGG